MQKIKYVSLLLVSTFLTSCGNNTHKIVLPYKIKNISAPVTLNSEAELTTLLNDEKDNNLVLVSYADDTCSCWSLFNRDVLTPFVTEKEIPIYVIETKYLDDYYGLLINETQSNTPVFGIYENGVFKYGATYTSNTKLFRELNSFKNYLNNLVTYPTNYKA